MGAEPGKPERDEPDYRGYPEKNYREGQKFFPLMTYAPKIPVSPNPPVAKGAFKVPLWQRGIEGDLVFHGKSATC